MSDNAIVRSNAEPPIKGSDSVEDSREKVLEVTNETKNFDVTGLLAKLMQAANMADAMSHVEKTIEYVVQIPVKHQEEFQSGELFLNQNSKTGVLWPTLYKTLDNGKRQFVDNLPIKQEEFIHGNPFESIAVSYHNLYMQERISELADEVKATYKMVERINNGMTDDRIGLLLAGRDQILYSLNAAPEERISAIESGRTQMLIAQSQILQTLKRKVKNFEPLPEGAFAHFKLELLHEGTLEQKDKEFYEIQEYYGLYLQATHFVAASYAICGRLEAAEQVFKNAEQEMAAIDFGPLKTLRYIHKKNPDMFYYHAEEYVETEKEDCLAAAAEYDTISITVSGEKLLEVFKDGREKALSESEA